MSAPTVYDVAERSGVSIATVSRVYRNPGSVRDRTRERVLEAARELGYVPSGNARGLASRTTGVLGLCFPDYADPDAEADAEADSDADDAAMLYSGQIIRGMERAARRHGYALLIAASLEGGPESLVAEVAGPDMPLIVTENGIATADDTRRVACYTGALNEVASAIEDGLDVRGYLAWSALDNYEWGSFAPAFGLIAVDRETFERTARPSALWLGSLGRTRELPRTAG
ncbi:family 1 glycosylhydrolase [Streptomyces sp. NPDC058330]|uniref:family 1 glycosylhydrolase n=1 Tax=Streptomyces sp. NPDC058330 TaxID=3346449 RepID=UPI0036E070AF